VNQIGYNGIGARVSGVKHSFRSISDNSQALVFWVLGGTHNLVTDKQVRRLFALGKVEMNLETAAAKAGMDAKTARKYRRLGRVPSELTPGPRWRTREDCFQEVWKEVQSLLEVNAGREAKTIFEYLQRRYAGRFADGRLRTLQRRSASGRRLGQ
jgi:hypothetical protein